MGGICSKGQPRDDAVIEIDKEVGGKSSKQLFAPSKRQDADHVVADDSGDGGAGGGGAFSRAVSRLHKDVVGQATLLIPPETEKKPTVVAAFNRTASTNGAAIVVHQRRCTVDAGSAPPVIIKAAGGDNEPQQQQAEIIIGMPNGFSGEHNAAGWPTWLTSVASEAIKGWLPRKAESFEKLDKIGQGTYSSVFKARDLETGKIVALKKVRFVNMDPESVRFMAREIHILRRLDHPNVIKLEGLITSRMSCSLYLVFQYMEHDLAGLAARPGIKFTEPQVKCFMKQLLAGLEHCHGRGVLHRDIKGSNLLIDGNGVLRIGDFGLATAFNPGEKNQLTSRVVTLWYRPPELLLGTTDYAAGVDLWSAGCILAELLAGKPIMPGRTEVEQMHKIFKLCGSPSEEFWMSTKLPHATLFKPQHPYPRRLREIFREFPAPGLDLLDTLLSIEPADRATAADALASQFFTVRPLACDPSSLPKFPPSKEFDVRLRNEEARRQGAAKRGLAESVRGTRHASAVGENRGGQTNLVGKYRGQEDRGSGLSIECPETNNIYGGGDGIGGCRSIAYSNHKAAPGRSSTTLGRSNARQLTAQMSCMSRDGVSSAAVDLANFTGLGSTKVNAKSDNFREPLAKQPHWPEHRLGNRYNQLDVADTSHHLLDRPASSHKKDERVGGRDSTAGYAPKRNRIHYSGPLMPPGGNIEDMLKEHERQIQEAVRKARLDKDKTKKNLC